MSSVPLDRGVPEKIG